MASSSLALAVLILALVASAVQSASANQRGSFLRGSLKAVRKTLRGSASSPPSDGPVRPLSIPDSKTPVHMLISAFQDGQRCANTIGRALLQAENPERLSFNVLQAAGKDDVDCLEEFKSRHLPKVCSDEGCKAAVLSRVHYWKIAPEEGEGPVHQRGLLSARADVSGKDSMCLSTDSHMDFTKDWDRDLLEDWTAADNEFAVLTAYPMATADAASAGKKSWISLCGYFLSNGVPRGATGGTMFNGEGEELGKPPLTMNWAAGQSFARCHAERNVPVDKHLSWMFDGEEVNRAVRLWTHGYDLYNPKVDVVLHNYTHANQKFWTYSSPTKDADEVASRKRLLTLLEGAAAEKDYGQFGLGTQRSLEDYVTWSHTDLGGKWAEFLRKKGITPLFEGREQPGSDSEFCKSLQRRPVRSSEDLIASIGE